MFSSKARKISCSILVHAYAVTPQSPSSMWMQSFLLDRIAGNKSCRSESLSPIRACSAPLRFAQRQSKFGRRLRQSGQRTISLRNLRVYSKHEEHVVTVDGIQKTPVTRKDTGGSFKVGAGECLFLPRLTPHTFIVRSLRLRNLVLCR
jgi:hypothetical protein